jgi:hypothetical protein
MVVSEGFPELTGDEGYYAAGSVGIISLLAILVPLFSSLYSVEFWLWVEAR